MQHPKFLDMNCKPKFLGRVPFTLKTGRMHYDRWQKGLEIPREPREDNKDSNKDKDKDEEKPKRKRRTKVKKDEE